MLGQGEPGWWCAVKVDVKIWAVNMEDCIGRSTACVIISAGIWARIHAGHFLHLVLNLGRNQYAISGWGHSKVVPTGFGLREQEKKPRTAGGGKQ